MTVEYTLIWVIRILFFAGLWLIVNRLGKIMTLGINAANELEIENTKRNRTLDDLIALTTLLERRQSELASTVGEKTETAAKVVGENLGRIELKVEAAAAASANAAEVANHMNEKIVAAHDKVVETIKELYQGPLVSVEVAQPQPEKKKKGDR